jgi:uncharacterized repeat protein (TIGR01451 family)
LRHPAIPCIFVWLAMLAPASAQSPPTSTPPVGTAAVPSAAPLNPAFLQYLDSAKRGAALSAITAGGHTLGLLPEPVDLSHLTVQTAKFTAQSLPGSYDLRTTGKITPVKDQGACGSCWTFGTYGSMESILAPGETWNFSENNLKDLHGFDWSPCSGGNAFMSMAYLGRWSGPVNESADPYHDTDVNTSPPGLPVQKHVQNVIIIPARGSATNNDGFKNALMTYGALDTFMTWVDASYNSSTASFYYNGSPSTNHSVTLVGWNDSYSRSNFASTPPGDGAFLIKNSWGTSWGQSGYFWVSYYDSGYAMVDNAYAFAGNEAITNYARQYSYDPLGWVASWGYNSPTAWFANVFTAVASETLQAVSFYVASYDSPYQVLVYTGITGGPTTGTLAGTTSGTFSTAGYHTVVLANPVPVTAGARFSVVVQLTTPGSDSPVAVEYALPNYSSAATASSGQSYMSSNGSSWSDTTTLDPTMNVCLKAYTGTGPYLTIAKTHSGNFTQGQTGAAYTIAVTNAGTLATNGTVTVTDTLPAGLTATAMSGTGWNCALSASTCTRSDALSAGGAYPAITLTANVASNAPSSVTNTATVAGGGETATSNNTATDPTTIQAVNQNMTIAKAHSGSFYVGQTGATYTITARNVGLVPTSGTVTVTDTLPAGLTATAMSGTGWSCTLSTLTCTRGDALSGGGAYPTITLTVNVGLNVPAPSTLVNSVTVAGGGETDTSDDTATDPTTIVNNATSQISYLFPDTAIAGGSTFTLSVAGSGFQSGAVVNWNATPLTTTFSSSNFVTANVPATWIANSGTATITVSNPGTSPSTSVAFIIATTPAVPNLTGGYVTYSWYTATGLFANKFAYVSGSGFEQGMTLAWNGTNLGSVNSGLGVNVPLSLMQAPGPVSIAATNPGGTASANLALTIPPLRSLTTIVPSAVSAGNASFTLTLNGTGFSAGDTVQVWPGGSLATNVVSATQIQATVPASMVASNATLQVWVDTETSSGSFASTNQLPLAVGAVGPVLSIVKTHTGNFTPGQQGATYTVTVNNATASGPTSATSGAVTVTETVPSGLTLISMSGTGWTCGAVSCYRSDALAGGASYPPITVVVNVSPTAPSLVLNSVMVSGGGSTTGYASDPTIVAAGPSWGIVKTHVNSFTQGQSGPTYTIAVANKGSAPTSGAVTVTDNLPSGLSATAMTGTGWNCTLSTLTCTRSDVLTQTNSYPAITLTVNVASNAPAQVTNQATVSGGGAPTASAGDPTAINAPATLRISKTHTGNFIQGQQGAAYAVNVSNTAGAGPTSGSVTVTEMLPTGLTLVSMAGTGWNCASNICSRGDALAGGSSYPLITVTVNVASNAPASVTNQVSVSGGGSATASASDPTITLVPLLGVASSHTGNFIQGQTGALYTVTVGNAAGAGPTSGSVTVTETPPSGLTLVSMAGTGWNCASNSCSRNDVLAGGSSYPVITVTVNVASSAPASVTNQVSVSGGGSATASASDPTAITSAPLLGVSSNHTGNFVQGQAGATYAVTVTNSASAGPTSGTVTVTETIPSGLTVVSMAGTGWNCATSTCSRSDALAGGSSYPVITVTVNVASNAPASVTNQVSVAGGGSATATTTDPTTINSPAALAIAKSHAGNFAPGQQGASYAIAVSNASGAAPTSGTVTVTETIPSGLTLVSMAGTGWNCASNICSRSDTLAGGSSYPVITVNVNVASNAPASVTNHVSVSGGGSATASTTDATSIAPAPLLGVSSSHTGNFVQGQTGATYGVTVTNSSGAGSTSGTVTVTEMLPSSLTLVSMAGTGWNCSSNICSRGDALAGGNSYPVITVTVTVASNAPASVTNQVSVSGGGSAIASAGDPTTIVPVPLLGVASSHAGNFIQGESGATYAVTVGNAAGAGPTSGAVTVTDMPPLGLTLVSMAGTGWTCAANLCTRSDALAGGGSYPVITVTVNVASNAPASVTNQVSVSGGGSVTVSASDPSIIAAGMPFFAGSVNGGGGTQFLQFPNGTVFGYYGFLSGAWMFHVDLGYEYVCPGNGPEVYLWDMASGHWWYTNTSTFPYLYDFTLNAWLYYFPDTKNAGQYTTNPRYFVNMTTKQIFTM